MEWAEVQARGLLLRIAHVKAACQKVDHREYGQLDAYASTN